MAKLDFTEEDTKLFGAGIISQLVGLGKDRSIIDSIKYLSREDVQILINDSVIK